MSKLEKTITELTTEYWDQKTKELNNLIDKIIEETGKTREEVIKDIATNTLIALPIEGDIHE